MFKIKFQLKNFFKNYYYYIVILKNELNELNKLNNKRLYKLNNDINDEFNEFNEYNVYDKFTDKWFNELNNEELNELNNKRLYEFNEFNKLDILYINQDKFKIYWLTNDYFDYEPESKFKNVFSLLDPSFFNYSGKIRYIKLKKYTSVIENILKGKKNGKTLQFHKNKIEDVFQYLNGKSEGKNWCFCPYYHNHNILVNSYHVNDVCEYRNEIKWDYENLNNIKLNMINEYNNKIKKYTTINFNENGMFINFINYTYYNIEDVWESKFNIKMDFHENCKVLYKFNDKNDKLELELSFEKLKIKF